MAAHCDFYYAFIAFGFLIGKFVEGVKPYQMTTVYIDRLDGSACKPHEFTKIRGLGGYIVSHDVTSLPTYKANQQCFFIIEAPENYQIAVEATQFDLGYQPNEEKCVGDSLFLFDNQPDDGKIFDSNLDMLREYCRTVSAPIPYTLATSSNNSITLYWHAAEISSRRPRSIGFKLKWFAMKKTIQQRRPDNLPVQCSPDKDFLCTNGQSCIPLELACDAEAHCNDESDIVRRNQRASGCENIESSILMLDDLSSGAIAAMAAVAAFTLLTIGLVARCCCCHNSTPLCTNGSGSPGASFKAQSASSGTTVASNGKTSPHHQSRNCYQPAPTVDPNNVNALPPHYYLAAQQQIPGYPHQLAPTATASSSGSGGGGSVDRDLLPPAPPPPSDIVGPTTHFVPPPQLFNKNIPPTAPVVAPSPLTMQNLHNFNNNHSSRHAQQHYNTPDGTYYGDPVSNYHQHHHHHYNNKPKYDRINGGGGDRHIIDYATDQQQYDYSAVKDFV